MSMTATAPQEPVTLVVVDDDAEVRTLLSRGLSRAGFSVLTAADGFAGLSLLARRPDVRGVLADVLMPGLDGPGFVSMARSQGLGTAASYYLMSGAPGLVDRGLVAELAIAGTIPKPFSLAELAQRIDADLRRTPRAGPVEEPPAPWVSAGIGWMLRALDWKDHETGAHCRRVAVHAGLIAAAMGLPPALVEDIRRAAPLHDIGKIGVPDAILGKPGPLDPGEVALIRRHTVIGHAILASEAHPLATLAAQIALHHHDRFDGSGYAPLAGHAIPLPARIVALADTYDALRSPRPYKAALTHEEAVRAITVGDARTVPAHFDPAVLEAFERCLPQVAAVPR
ncbi:HD domain-containing phosphohydrolase [Rhodospirillum centenum]|uniref:Response regulator receiver domain protein n=1 Tax=Rhodospirillum centenum (strain ATCC 51521 / SW) TaxID=414684 RepID=B6IYM0_RHOCS|nr:HD domain-containing phosphohydrolase [Rhodospirillum centenum]ACJ01394.1 response regulator receiver domain protein [Rhodospirillum centenum SW]